MRGFFFLLLFIGNCTICSMRELPITHLEHIDFFQLECVKEASNNTHTRTTYRDGKNGYFYKVWTHNYWRSNHFLGALKAGFFDGLTSLVGIICDEKDCCRGYITSEGSIIKDRIEIERIITGKFFIQDSDKQSKVLT